MFFKTRKSSETSSGGFPSYCFYWFHCFRKTFFSQGEPALLATTVRIRLYHQRYHPAPDPPAVGDQFSRHDANIGMHDSALFDVNVEVTFYDGRRIQIPQQSTPPGWTAPF